MRKSNILLALFVGFMGVNCTTVGPNSAGVLTSCTGVMKEDTLSEGFHVTGLDSVEHFDLGSTTFTVSVPYGSAETAVTSDRQQVGYSFDISYQIASGIAARNLYYHNRINNVDEFYNTVQSSMIKPVVDQAVKNVLVQYNLDHVLRSREAIRIEVANEISRILEERLTAIDQSLSETIKINQVNLTNLDWAPELRQAIERTQVTAQERLQAQQELERRTIEFQITVREAEAEGSAEIARAQATSQARLIEAESRRNYYETIRLAGIDADSYAQTELFMNHWNGVLPMFISGGDDDARFSIPMPMPQSPQ